MSHATTPRAPVPVEHHDRKGLHMMRRSGVRTVALGGLLVLGVTGCGSGGSGGGVKPGAGKAAAESFHFTINNAATGPAPDVPGSRKGGTINLLERDDFAHLDPARVYVNFYQSLSQMITRQLTTYRSVNGKVELVGDLATNTGTTTDGGKTWTFTLRDGITYQDGTPIVAADIKYGVERAFAPEYAEGPTYIMEWLAGTADFHKVYSGPYKGKHLAAIEAPDAKTVVFHFDKPRPDMPFAAALTTTAPVPAAKDTKAAYDLKPFASGPYKITTHVVDKTLVLEKNTSWVATSDPARHQYVDSYVFKFGTEPLAINQRLIAANGADATTMTLSTLLSPEVLQQVDTTAALKARTVLGYTPFVLQYNINNSRITDVEVRKALLVAFPKQQARQVVGGTSAGDFATTVSSPTLVGHEAFDLYNAPPTGDPVRAKAILAKAGKSGQTIVYGYVQSPRGEQVAVAVSAGLEKAGFKVVKKPISAKNFYDVIGKVNNPYDLYSGGWGADWPSGSTVYPPTLDGRKIAEQAPNYSHFNDPTVNAEMDRISAETNLIQAGKDWAALDRKIMAEVPYIPYLYDKAYQMYGPNVGGVYLDQVLGEPSLNGVYVKV
ncbi:MAG: ABC transporter substrate-binding protein [Actinomycetota bacterium]|nr:ABC transporter substrate-binding protein [Actinomycetota bacterium]